MKYEIYLCAQVQSDKEADIPLIFRFWFKILSGEGQRDINYATSRGATKFRVCENVPKSTHLLRLMMEEGGRNLKSF